MLSMIFRMSLSIRTPSIRYRANLALAAAPEVRPWGDVPQGAPKFPLRIDLPNPAPVPKCLEPAVRLAVHRVPPRGREWVTADVASFRSHAPMQTEPLTLVNTYSDCRFGSAMMSHVDGSRR